MKKNIYIILLLIFGNYLSFSQAPNCIWAQSGKGVAKRIATDDNGNTYITGHFGNSVITWGSFNLYLAANASSDIFIVKLDPNGNALWAKNVGAIAGEGTGIAVDTIGNVYVTGWYSAGAITFDTISLINSGLPDVFVAKLDPFGNAIWAKRAGGSNNDFSYSISLDNNNNVFITGNFTSNSISFGNITLQNSFLSYPDLFVVKYDNNGNATWAKNFGGNTGFPSETSNSIATDNSGNSYIVGKTGSDSISFDNGLSYIVEENFSNFFLVKFDPFGNTLLSKGFNSSGPTVPIELKTDFANNVFICGNFSDSLFADSISLNGFGMDDVFIIKLNSNGQVQWANASGGNDDDVANGIAVSDNGYVYLTGNFESPIINFDTISLNITAGPDMFLAQYDYNGNAVRALKGTTNVFVSDYGYSVVANSNFIIWSGFWSNNNLSISNCSLNNGGSFVVKFDEVTGLNEMRDLSNYNFFPNPSTGEFFIDVNGEFRSNLKLIISNLLGELIHEINITQPRQEIRVSLSNGIYIATILTENDISSKVISIQH